MFHCALLTLLLRVSNADVHTHGLKWLYYYQGVDFSGLGRGELQAFLIATRILVTEGILKPPRTHVDLTRALMQR